MKNNDLHDAIGEIDEAIVADVTEKRKASKKARFAAVLKYASVAACVCIIILGTVLFGMGSMKDNEPPEDIPAADTVCTLTEDAVHSDTEPTVTEESERDPNESPETAESLSDKNSQNEPEESTDISADTAGDVVKTNSRELTAGVTSIELGSDKVSPADYSLTVADFSFDLFRATMSGGDNEMISPLSALYALTMCADSVEGESLKQIEDAVGLSRDEMNRFVRSYMDSLPNGRGYSLKCANSVWLRDSDSLTVDGDYLNTVKSYLSAQVYTSPFDQTSVDDINKWVKLNTDGMIDGIIDSIDPMTYLYLINTIAFDAKWSDPLTAIERELAFTLENGEQKMYDGYMVGKSNDGYLEDDTTTGFIYNYKQYFASGSPKLTDTFAMVVLLPNEGITINDYINSLNGEKIHSLIQNKKSTRVSFTLPSFKSSYSESLVDSFRSLGINNIFSPDKIEQDSFNVNELPLYYSDAIQKTYIEVNTGGTKAASVSALLGQPMSADPPGEQSVIINVDRPFVYMIVDCENGIPLFIGTVTDPTN